MTNRRTTNCVRSNLLTRTFIPRIPKNRLPKEDDKTKRICLSPSIQDACSSFPHKTALGHKCYSDRPMFLAVYSLPTVNDEHAILTPDEIKEYVPDAMKTNEHWLLKPLQLEAEIIRITSIKYEFFNKNTGELGGMVTNLTFEKEIENVDRIGHAVFYHSKIAKQFVKACNLDGIEILDELITKEQIRYFGYIPSSRLYTKRHYQF